MVNVGILGLGIYLPSKKLTNFDLEKMVDTSDEWIRARTGIVERRVASVHEKTSYMAFMAAKRALKDAKIAAEKVDLIVVATISPDSNFPSMACKVQKAIGATKAIAFDVSAACAGYLYALTTAKQYIQTGMARCALVIASERFTNLIDWKDRDTCVLFGDGAGACVLKAVRSGGIKADFLQGFGDQWDLMEVVVSCARGPFNPEKTAYAKLPYVAMKGPELFKMAVNSMADAIDVQGPAARPVLRFGRRPTRPVDPGRRADRDDRPRNRPDRDQGADRVRAGASVRRAGPRRRRSGAAAWPGGEFAFVMISAAVAGGVVDRADAAILLSPSRCR